ncbi:MAG TPA: hypothetical protein VFU40_07870 [Gemmatimonadales bacterium]|nr:hypothetical protein [Gemmatimonadales bacterium]
MARVVDRLLAQLPGLQVEPVYSQPSSSRPTVVTAASTAPRLQEPTQSEVIGVWIRVILGLSLGIMMSSWPYDRACGFPLFGYLVAVLTVVLAGMWAAAAAWRFRSGLAHAVALILVLYGIALTTAELLPRTGYATQRATWSCDADLLPVNPQ